MGYILKKTEFYVEHLPGPRALEHRHGSRPHSATTCRRSGTEEDRGLGSYLWLVSILLMMIVIWLVIIWLLYGYYMVIIWLLYG